MSLISSESPSVRRVDSFGGAQARRLLAALDSVGLRFIALRLDPDPSQPVVEIDLLVPLLQRELKTSLMQVSTATPFLFSLIKSSTISSTVIAGLIDGETLRLVSLDIRGPIIKQEARLSLFFGTVHKAGVQRPDSFAQPAPSVESTLLTIRNQIDGRGLNAKHERILAACEESDGLRPTLWSSRFQHALPALGLLSAIQKGWFTFTQGRRATNIAFHGPDGAGKSTVAHSVADALISVGIGASVWHYLRPIRNDPDETPRSATPSRLLRTKLWIRRFAWFYLAVSAVLRTRVSGHVLLHDRYIHDILEKDVRKGVRHPIIIEKLLSFLSGFYSTAFVLTSPTERMLDRGEQTPDEIQSSLSRARRIPGRIHLDGSLSPKQLAAQVLQEWLKTNAI